MKLELFYFDQCPFCQLVLRTIDQLNLKEKITFKNTMTDGEAASFHQTTTGRSTVPCLYVDDKPMFESGDIAQWLTDHKDKL